MFVIGGSSIYEQFLPIVDSMYINEIQRMFNGDSNFPDYNEREWDTTTETTIESTANETLYKIKVKYLKRRT
ncbi:dihydrofolate reductase [Paenibacillus sp. QZ-Y1]|uniref:dihydrofolate reductase n=1 Tax=Paenibacillus sp. QZ-Y1 TaxID=3414511 RepID=UPI003F79FC51